MSLVLDMGTEPVGLTVKTVGIGRDDVFIGEYRISMPDFVETVKYVLTNSNLMPDDARMDLVAWVRRLHLAPGHGNEGARYTP